MKRFSFLPALLCLVAVSPVPTTFPNNEYAAQSTNELPFVVETKGPVRARRPSKATPDLKVSGQGFWKFMAARDRVPVPPPMPHRHAGSRHHHRG
jgi:hypothetical protein